MIFDNRQSFRLRQRFDVHWAVPKQGVQGEGTIYNISLAGMLFITDGLFKPDDALKMSFNIPGTPEFPSKGELVWFNKVEGKGFKCGIRFLDDTNTQAWRQWMEDNILKLADTEDSRVLDQLLHGDRQE